MGISGLQASVQALQSALQPLCPGLQAQFLPQADSSNTRLLQLAPSERQPTLLVVEHQTAGRGRQGRVWAAERGASLTFSLGLHLAPPDWGGLSSAVALGLARALDPTPAAPPRLRIKWPNDLWLLDAPQGPGRKLAGILIETLAPPAGTAAPGSRWVVLGVGLNIEPLRGGWAAPPDAAALNTGYACTRELQPDWDAARVLQAVAAPLVQAVRQFEAQGFGELRQACENRELLIGRDVVLSTGPVRAGRCEALDDDGALLVRDAATGMRHRVVSGEVSVRLHPDAGEVQTAAS